MPIPVAAWAVGLAVSASLNVYQGVQNRKLRQEVERLTAIVADLNNQVEQLSEEIRKLKFWSFMKAKKLKQEKEALEQQILEKEILIQEMKRWGPSQREKVRFVHLNHTNPLLKPNTPQRRALERAGFSVAKEGESFAL